MNKILVLTDFSKFSECATRTGMAIAKRSGAKLVLLHLIKVPSDWKKGKEDDFPEIKKATGQAEENFHKLEQEIENDGPEIVTKILFDKDREKINDHISSREHDLVVIGSEGQNSFKKKIIGSTALNILDNSSVPVLIIHKPYFEGLFDKILFPSDFDDNVNEHFNTVVQLAKAFDSELHLLHVMTTFPTITAADAKERMQEFKGRYGSGVNIQTKIEDATTVEDGILSYQRREGIKLIALVTHKYPWLMKKLQFSITEKLINSGEATIMSLNVGKR